jgi:RNA polymerase sigma-70 factor, ECF subfamily
MQEHASWASSSIERAPIGYDRTHGRLAARPETLVTRVDSIAAASSVPRSVRGASGSVRAVRLEELDDETLVIRLRDGDEQALAALYRRYGRYVAGLCFRLLGSEGEVPDVVQDTFVEVSVGIGQLRDPGAFKAWLRTIAIRAIQARIRARRRARWFGLLSLTPPHRPPPQTELVEAQRLYQELDRLPPRLRIPWALHRIEGETLEETARLCKTSLPTIKRRIAGAEARLKKVIDAR